MNWKDRLLSAFLPLGKRGPGNLPSWLPSCIALVIPLTPILHHLVFDRHRCILETHGRDYTLKSVLDLFLHDPSLPWAIAAMFLVYHLGKTRPALRMAAVPALIASIPLVIWLWDIPFSSRFVCRHLHDGRVGFSTKHVFAFCLLIYLALQAVFWIRRLRNRSGAVALFLRRERPTP